MKSIFRLATYALACAATTLGTGVAIAAEPKSPTVLVTGSNRGIGLEFARQYAEKGWRVIATVRDPKAATELQAIAAKHSNLTIEKLDVDDNAAIEALAAKYKGQPIDVLLNNAGWLGEPAAQALDTLDYETFENVLRTNTYAPLKLSQAFLPNVEAGSQKKIIAITSGLSSISGVTRFGNLYFYRVSKAGLNMAMRTLQADVRAKGIKVGILAPGVVETRLLAQSGWKGPEALKPEDSAAAVIKNIENLTETAAGFTLYNGETVSW